MNIAKTSCDKLCSRKNNRVILETLILQAMALSFFKFIIAAVDNPTPELDPDEMLMAQNYI